MGHHGDDHGSDDKESFGHHHILSDQTALKILVGLLALTVLTVVTARLNLGILNGPIAIAIACLKAGLVVFFFMGLKYDSNENRVFFFSSFAFFMIFVVLTFADVFTREGNWRVTEELLKTSGGGGQKFAKFWQPQDAVKAHGKELYTANCVVCHGEAGLGNGAAAAALNPKPRNFTEATGWKNGRGLSQIVLTLTNGLNAMPQFNTLPLEDRFALAQYVQAFGPKANEDTPEDLKKVGITDPTADNGGMGGGAGEAQKRELPLDFALDRYVDTSRK